MPALGDVAWLAPGASVAQRKPTFTFRQYGGWYWAVIEVAANADTGFTSILATATNTPFGTMPGAPGTYYYPFNGTTGSFPYDTPSGGPDTYNGPYSLTTNNALTAGTYRWRLTVGGPLGVNAMGLQGTFTIAHPPDSAFHVPQLGNPLAVAAASGGNIQLPLDWEFSDPAPGDTQTAYTAQAWQVAAPGTIVSTGDVVSAVSNVTLTIPQAWEGTDCRWRVRVRDLDNTWGPYSSDKAFTPYFRPTATITVPTPAQVFVTPQPTFVATFGATAGRTGAQQIFNIYTGSVGALGPLVDSSGWQPFIGSWSPSSPVVAVGPNYVLEVAYQDNKGLISVVDQENFTANYPAISPAVFTLSHSIYPTQGGVIIDWAGTVTLDVDFRAWRVYRREPSGAWELVRELPLATTSWIDYLAPSDVTVEYAVVQVAVKFAADVESVRTPQSFYDVTERYFLVLPDEQTLNLTLYHVTGESFSDEQEMAGINLIGRGRRVEYGTRFGRAGSLSAQLYDNIEMTARQQRLWLEAIRDSGRDVYLRNPFGDIWRIALMSASIQRIPGVGRNEYATVTIEYVEITA
jgi:hypothetical protein